MNGREKFLNFIHSLRGEQSEKDFPLAAEFTR